MWPYFGITMVNASKWGETRQYLVQLYVLYVIWDIFFTIFYHWNCSFNLKVLLRNLVIILTVVVSWYRDTKLNIVVTLFPWVHTCKDVLIFKNIDNKIYSYIDKVISPKKFRFNRIFFCKCDRNSQTDLNIKPLITIKPIAAQNTLSFDSRSIKYSFT